MDEKPRIVAYKLIIDANIVKHKGRTERQNIERQNMDMGHPLGTACSVRCMISWAMHIRQT
jgi:hypothetical protein